MLAFPRRGLVLLAMPKCATTAIESKLRRVAKVSFTGGGLKHTSMAGFERHLQPLLEQAGWSRSSYEVVCLFREPVDWVSSWWCYRSRESLKTHPERSANFAGDMSLDEFAQAYIDRRVQVDGDSQSAFVRGVDGQVGVDRLFRYDRLDQFLDYLQDKLGRKVHLEQLNVSPPREQQQLSEDVRGRLQQHLRSEYEIYENIAQ